MKEIEGYILKTGSISENGHMYSKDCEINFPENIPIVLGLDFNKPGEIVGNAKVIKKDDGVYIEGNIIDSVFENDSLTHMGLYATNVEKEDNIVTKMNIQDVAVLPEHEAAMPECKIIKKEM